MEIQKSIVGKNLKTAVPTLEYWRELYIQIREAFRAGVVPELSVLDVFPLCILVGQEMERLVQEDVRGVK